MSQRTEIFDLGALRLHSGEGRRVQLSVPIEGFDLGGQRYESASPFVEIALDVSRTTTGYAMRIQFEALLEGPCMRCLGDASRRTPVDAYEIDQPGGGDELSSPYLVAGELDVHAWARDALLLALPAQIVCRDDCLGLCPECGVNLNDAGPEHKHEAPAESPWAKLDELSFE
jgi:uncharacterized protein